MPEVAQDNPGREVMPEAGPAIATGPAPGQPGQIPKPGDPAFEGAVIAAIMAHPSKKQRDDGSYHFSAQAYQEIGDRFSIRNDQVSRIANKHGIVRRGAGGVTPAPDGVPTIGKTAEPKRKVDKQKNQQIVTLFAVGFHSLYSLIAQFEGKHWELKEDEADEAAGQLKQALDTLEGEEYEKAIALLSRCAPWASLGVCLWSITKPRLERTRTDRAAKKHAEIARGPEPDTVGNFNGAAYTGPVASENQQPLDFGSEETIGRGNFANAIDGDQGDGRHT